MEYGRRKSGDRERSGVRVRKYKDTQLKLMEAQEIVLFCSWNENGPLRLTGIGTIRKCALDVIGVTLLEELCHWGGSEAQARLNGYPAVRTAS